MKKPIIRYECDPSLDHVEVVIRAPEQNEMVKNWMKKLNELSQNTLTAYNQNGVICSLPVADIVTVSVVGKTVNIVTEQDTYYTNKSLQSLEAELDPLMFVRISRFELVNLRKVLRYDFTVPGTLQLELKGGSTTWASRRCIPAIRRKLAEKE